MRQTIVWLEKSENARDRPALRVAISFPMQEFLSGPPRFYYYVIKLSCGFCV